MCEKCENDVISELAAMDDFDSIPAAVPQGDGLLRTGTVESQVSQSKIARYEESCKACRGSGRFISWAGRDVGPCHKCKGKGKIFFKTSPEARAKKKELQEAKKRREAEEKANVAEKWMEANPRRALWMRENGKTFEFAAKMMHAVFQYGSLTENQLAAIDRCIAREEGRAKQQEEANKAGFTLSKVPSGRYAVKVDGKDVLVKIDNVAKGKWQGWVFVKNEETGDRLGSQRPGNAYNGQYAKELSGLAENALEHAKAYGRVTGNCCICGRELTNPESIEAGIGPICASRF